MSIRKGVKSFDPKFIEGLKNLKIEEVIYIEYPTNYKEVELIKNNNVLTKDVLDMFLESYFTRYESNKCFHELDKPLKKRIVTLNLNYDDMILSNKRVIGINLERLERKAWSGKTMNWILVEELLEDENNVILWFADNGYYKEVFYRLINIILEDFKYKRNINEDRELDIMLDKLRHDPKHFSDTAAFLIHLIEALKTHGIESYTRNLVEWAEHKLSFFLETKY